MYFNWKQNILSHGHCGPLWYKHTALTHWSRVTHICVSKLTIIGSDNGLSPGRRQAIIWTNAGLLLIGPLGTNFSEMLIEIHTFSFKKIHLKMSPGKWRPFCLGLNMLKVCEIFLWRYGHFITQFFVVTLTYAGIYASFYWNRSLAPLTLKAQQ